MGGERRNASSDLSALDAADDRFAHVFGAAIVLAIVMYTAVVVTHPTEAIPTPPTAR